MKQGFWRGNVPALLLYMPYTAIQFTVLHKLKTFAAGSSKTGMQFWERLLIFLLLRFRDITCLYSNSFSLSHAWMCYLVIR